MKITLRETGAAAARSLLALMLAVCMVLAAMPEAAVAASEKYYIHPSKAVTLTSSAGTVTAGTGNVLEMVSQTAVTSGGVSCYEVYYGGVKYTLPASDVASTDILSATALNTYVASTLWTATTFSVSLKKDANLTADLNTYAMQLALQRLGYLDTDPDGGFGDKTDTAVKAFQKANSIEQDGIAGPLTLAALYKKVLAAATPTPTPTPTPAPTLATSGTLKTIAKVNLRQSRSTNALRLGSVPEGTVLTYYDARQDSDGTWYKVIYKSNTGWLLGTYVTTDLSTGTGTSSSLLPTGSIRTTSKVNIRKETSTNSLRLGSVPENTIVRYSSSETVSGITWYKITYNNVTGWIMGTYTSTYSTNTSTSTSTPLPTGSVRTTAKVNLRASAGTSAKRLGSVPENVILTYLDTSTSDGVTWYKVSYKGETGWIMGTYTSTYYASGSSSSSSSTSGTTSPTAGTLKTTSKVNLRKKTSVTSTRLAQVPAGVNLSYTTTSVVNGVTWFYTTYNGQKGWLMGTYVSATGSSASAAIGTVTITKAGTRVRDAADGNKTGVVLSKGTTVSLLASPVTSGGYTWYNIRTSSGVVGYVRGDCATISSSSSGSGSGSGSSSTTVYSSKTFAKLPAGTIVFKESTRPTSGYKTLHEEQVLMLSSNTTYTKNSTEYISLYYRDEIYNTEYANVKNYILSDSAMADYLKTLYETKLDETLKQSQDLVGNVQVYALQLGLQSLGLYTGNLDGSYGSGTTSAVRNLQRQAGLKVDGECGTNTWSALASRIGYININGGSAIVTPDSSTSAFGTVTSVQKLYWDFDNNCTAEFPKYSYATIMDVATKKVFTVYRWAGGNHADCVPATEADTKTMCEIVGFTYNSSRPTSAQKQLIIADDANSNATYTWPDFKNSWGGATKVGSAWDRRAVLVNIGGKVYPASIYGWPHGYLGESKGVGAMKLGGKSCCEYNNYYGMMCIHFYNSTTHSGTSGSASGHETAINEAWNYAKSVWPTLCK